MKESTTIDGSEGISVTNAVSRPWIRYAGVLLFLISLAAGVISYFITEAIFQALVISFLLALASLVVELYVLFRESISADSLMTKPLLRQVLPRLSQSYSHASEEPSQLFRRIVDSRLTALANETAAWESGQIVFTPHEVEAKGIEVFRHLRRGGYATFLVDLQEFWDVQKEYHQLCREIAPQRDITRVFIVPDEEALSHPNLRQQIELDDEADLTTKIAFAHALPADAVKDFGLWDDEIVCEVHYSKLSSGVTGGTFSVRELDLSRARDWIKMIESKAVPARPLLDSLRPQNVEERREKRVSLLGESASVMRAIAEARCAGSYVDSGSCRWYHGSWQYLRLTDSVSTPEWHNGFFVNGIRLGLKQVRNPSVLVSGTADYAMLAQVLDAVDGTANPVRVVVLDACPTPLDICSWFVEKTKSQRIETRLEDIRSTSLPSSSFDVIVTDAFLTRFSKADRQRVIDQWERILKPGGAVVTTIRVEKGPGLVKATNAEIERFVGGVVKTSRERQLSTPEHMREIANTYAKTFLSQPVMDEAEVRALFRDFRVELRFAPTPGEFHPSIYVQVVARKLHPNPPVFG